MKIKRTILSLLASALAAFMMIGSAAASVAEAENEARVGDVASPQWGGKVEELYFESIDIYAYTIDSFGQSAGIDVNGTHASWYGSNKAFFCYLTDEFLQGMVEENYKYFYCDLNYYIEGTKITKYEVLLDDEVIYTKTSGLQGFQNLTWKCPRTTDMTIEVKVYIEDRIGASIFGRVITPR